MIPAPVATRSFVRGKCDYFASVHLWPRREHMDFDGWLANFTDAEMDHAVHLLNAVLYYSADLVHELFKSAFHQLSRVVARDAAHGCPLELWRKFRHQLIVTYATGEAPNATDSGLFFARMARQQLGIDESQIVSPEAALRRALAAGGPIVFVDDFVGSGDQFNATWTREYDIGAGAALCFAELPSEAKTSFYYCPVICTECGKAAINVVAPEVRIYPAHLLDSRYSAFSDDSIFWPDHLRPTAVEFIRNASARAGITDWRGYRGLGLSIAFEHGVPDATLPLYYHELGGWTPLVRKR